LPEDTSRTFSTLGKSSVMRVAIFSSASVGAPNESPLAAASCTALTVPGWAWPRIAGPHEPT